MQFRLLFARISLHKFVVCVCAIRMCAQDSMGHRLIHTHTEATADYQTSTSVTLPGHLETGPAAELEALHFRGAGQ